MTEYLYSHWPLALSAVKDQPREYHIENTEGITGHGLVRVRRVPGDLPKDGWTVSREIEDPTTSSDQLWFWISHFKVNSVDANFNVDLYEKNFVYHYDTKRYLYVELKPKPFSPFVPDIKVMDRAGFETKDFLGECDLPHIEAAINRFLNWTVNHSDRETRLNA